MEYSPIQSSAILCFVNYNFRRISLGRKYDPKITEKTIIQRPSTLLQSFTDPCTLIERGWAFLYFLRPTKFYETKAVNGKVE